MTTFDEKLARLNRKRKKIVYTFYKLKAEKPKHKKFNLLQETAKSLEYSIDKRSRSSSYVMQVIREWEAEQ